jgi:hypothetical protein
VAVAGLFLPKHQAALESPAPAPAMVGDIVDIQPAGRYPCCTFSVRIHLSGFNGQDCLLRATLINTTDGSETRGDALIFTPEADAYQTRANVSVSAADAGTYTPRFILYDSGGVELDRRETQPVSMDPYDHDTRDARPGERLSGRNPIFRVRPDQPGQRFRSGAVHRRFYLDHEFTDRGPAYSSPNRAEPSPSLEPEVASHEMTTSRSATRTSTDKPASHMDGWAVIEP